MGWKPDVETLEEGEISLEITTKEAILRKQQIQCQKRRIGMSAGSVAERTGDS